MNTLANASPLAAAGNRPSPRSTRQLLKLLESLNHGALELRLPDGAMYCFGHGEPLAHLHVQDEAMFDRILGRGDIGFAESYLAGEWDSPDLTALLTLLASNRTALQRAIYGNALSLLLARVQHWLNHNSKTGSQRNIMAHYDLGNDFYRQWLDSSMTYSSALFSHSGNDAPQTLASAQAAKYGRILDRLDAQPGQQLLEIGCGWGGMAEAAVRRGLNLYGITLSPSQLAYARQRMLALHSTLPGLNSQAVLALRDYRDLDEQYDHIVSIEMFEAVGERYWPGYFRTLKQALKPGAASRAVIQTIVIDESLFASYRKGTDFIQQYIFPGGMLPSPQRFRTLAEAAGLAVRDEFHFGLDYARTLKHWREAFEAAWPQIAPLGFDDTFRRLWRFYLAYCEAGFLAGNISVVQYELAHA